MLVPAISKKEELLERFSKKIYTEKYFRKAVDKSGADLHKLWEECK